MVDPAEDSVSVNYDPFADGALERVVPTTEPQREVWLADQLGREASLAYNESIIIKLSGALEISALRAALIDLVQRHEALRSTVSKNGQELRVAETGSVELRETDLSAKDDSSKQAALDAASRRAVETAFDLESGPLLRAELFKLGDAEHVLIPTAHHIVCDGWSFGVIVRDLVSLYAKHGGIADSKLESPSSFVSYAAAQDSPDAGKQTRHDEAYWLSQYQSAPPSLDLPTDRARGTWRTFESKREDHVLDQALVARLRKVGGRSGTGLFATLLGVFSNLMHRLSGTTDLVIGVPAAGQLASGQDNLVGHCVSLLPLRLQIDPLSTAGDLLAATQTRLLDAYEHQTCTFGSLLQQLSIERDPSRPTLVSVMFNVDQALGEKDLDCPGLSIEIATNPRSYETFELFLNAVPSNGGLRLECQFNSHLFDSQTIRAWMLAYETLLRSTCELPDSPIRDLEFASRADHRQLTAWNDTSLPFSSSALVHELIEAQAARTPSRQAIMWGSGTVSYGELDARANQIAHSLHELGVARGTLVGLHVGRSPDMVAAVFAVLKVGATYVPLDPSYPFARLAFMVEDSRLAVLVSEESASTHNLLPKEKCLLLDAHRGRIDGQSSGPVTSPESKPAPGEAAYVIYTSGSTGMPKGVCVPHRAVVNFLQSMERELGLTQEDRMVAVTTLSFDIAINELLMPLVVGAAIVLATRDEARDGARLGKLLESSRATAMQATPATWRLLLAAGWNGQRDFKAMCGGEALPRQLAEQLLERCGTLWNLYGPTETTVWSSCARIASGAASIPVGRPIANTSVWVLNEQQMVCPVDVPGELWIGGEGVAIGYLHRPELTAERFVPDPFSEVAGSRMYRTGDRGRWRANGVLELAGRQDFQVKVRGFRIELGEIESCVTSHSGVAEAVAITREDQPGDVRIAVYFVAEPCATPTAAEIRAHLAGALPDYMVPQHLICLSELPRLPNRKVDRASLPAPAARSTSTSIFVKPRSATEAGVAEEVASVLGLGQIGIHDDFFVLGGHSLLAAQLIHRLNRRFEVELSIRAVFEGPTVALLSAAVGSHAGTVATQSLRIVVQQNQDRAAASVAQERLWWLEKLTPGRVAYHAPSAHRLLGPLNEPAFERAFREVVRRQPSLRTYFERVDGNVEQCVCDEVPVTLFPAESLASVPAAKREIALLERLQELTAELFDLSSAPLFKVKVLKVSEEDHVFFFMAHHIVWDGWSFDLLYEEMSALYAAYAAGEASPLADLAVTYSDYAVWHRGWIEGDECARQSSYWRDQIQGHGRLSPLPVDRPPLPAPSGAGATEWISIDGRRTSALHELAAQAGATQFVVTLTLFGALLYDFSRQDKLVIGTPVRGRPAPELEVIMGYFNNLLLLSLELRPAESFVDLVARVKASVVASFAVPDAPLESIASATSKSPEAGARLLYQALFSFQDTRQRPVRWGNLRHSMIPLFQSGVTEDIGMWLVESSEGLQGGLTYNTDVLEASTARWLVQRYVELVDQVLADPLAPVASMIGPPTAAVTSRITRLNHLGSEGLPGKPVTNGSARPDYVAPTSDLEVQLVSIWQSTLGVERVGINDNFFDLGGNSLGALNMVSEVERSLAVTIDPDVLIQSPTIAGLGKVLSRPKPSGPGLVVLQRGGARNLFLTHDGEGATLLYLGLASLMPRGITVVGITPPTQPRVPLALTSIEEMAQHYVRCIRQRQPQGPYLLGGLCAGGLIAYEMAVQLKQLGESVELVVVMDGGTPQAQVKPGLRFMQRHQRFSEAIATVQTSEHGKVKRGWLFVSMLLQRGYRACAWEVSSRMYVCFAGMRVALLRRLLRGNRPWPMWLRPLTFREIYQYAVPRYKPTPLTGMRVVLARASAAERGDGDRSVLGIDDTPYIDIYDDELLGWGDVAAELAVIDVAGGHSSMLWEPHVSSLAVALRPFLAVESGDESGDRDALQ
jgi:amino acid adenylation domain-containing protein